MILADRVYETSTTQGTGTLNLAGAATGFQTFVAGVGDGAEVPYFIDDGTDWETGLGTVTSGSPDTLSRDTIYASSNSDAAVNWGSGTRNVRLYPSATVFPTLRRENTWTEENTFEKGVKFQGPVQFQDDGELTLASGEITITGSNHTIDTESDAASDDLDTINGGSDGAMVTLRIENDAREITLKDGTGNIETPDGEDILLTDDENAVTLQYDGALSKWLVKSTFRSLEGFATEAYVDAATAGVRAPLLTLLSAGGTTITAQEGTNSISGQTNPSTGVYTFTWDTATSDANYVVMVNADTSSTTSPLGVSAITRSTTEFSITLRRADNNSLINAEVIDIVVWAT